VRVTILTVGSRGDVQPLVAFGAGLRDAGHEVRLATHPRYASLVTRHNLEFAPLAEGHISQGAETEEGRRWIETSRRMPTAVGFLRDARSVARQRLADADRACADADAVIAANLAILLAWQVAGARGTPLIRAYIEPPVWMMGRPGTARLAPLIRQLGWLAARPWLNTVRRDVLGAEPLGRRNPLAELDRRRELALLAFSAAVLPLPAAAPDHFQSTGYWFLDRTDDPEPPHALRAFLADGPPPIAIGFSTMIDRDAAATARLAADALQRAGCRGVLFGRDASMLAGQPPAHLYAIESVEHQWLFSHVRAAVHHAGVGTTAAALRAGIPMVGIPHMTDQFTWARRVHELGVGPAPIPRRELTVDRLTSALRFMTNDDAMRRRAAALGERIRREDGVARAVATFERRVPQPSHRKPLTATPLPRSPHAQNRAHSGR
jgi:sterol 3beta-glucosyltransferase